jgi:hypothetical protein
LPDWPQADNPGTAQAMARSTRLHQLRMPA